MLYRFEIDIKVHDKAALFAAALLHAVNVDGMDEADAREDLMDDDGEVNVAACIQTILDPGISPRGADIQESACHQLDV